MSTLEFIFDSLSTNKPLKKELSINMTFLHGELFQERRFDCEIEFTSTDISRGTMCQAVKS
jgi:hypothetical protein